jgi:hypothetical protein
MRRRFEMEELEIVSNQSLPSLCLKCSSYDRVQEEPKRRGRPNVRFLHRSWMNASECSRRAMVLDGELDARGFRAEPGHQS